MVVYIMGYFNIHVLLSKENSIFMNVSLFRDWGFSYDKVSKLSEKKSNKYMKEN